MILFGNDKNDGYGYQLSSEKLFTIIKNLEDTKTDLLNIKKSRRRKIYDFMYNDTQYVKAGEVHLQITPTNEIKAISQSQYYAIKKKADNDAV